MKNKNLKLIPFTAIVFLTVTLIVSLPLPFTPFGNWLEKLFNPNYDNCDCLCPWWIFSIWQILVSCLIFRFEKIKDQDKKTYVAKIAIVAFLTWLMHLTSHNYYLAKEMIVESVFCSWFWLITLVLGLASSLLNIDKKED